MFDHVTMTFPTKVLIVPLSTLHKKCNIPENISLTSQVQQTAANIEMHMDQRVTRLLTDEQGK